MMLLRFLLTSCLIMAFEYNLSYCAQQTVTQSGLTKARTKQISEFEKNGIRKVIRDYADTVVLIYSISNEANDDGLIYNTSVRQRLKKHHYKTGVSSGVILSQDGIICTTNTGIMNSDTFIVSVNSELRSQVNDNKITLGKNDYKAELIKAFPTLNLAFLRINPRNKHKFHYAQLGTDNLLMSSKDRILLNNSVVIGKTKGENFVNALRPAYSKNNFSIFSTGVEQLKYQADNGDSRLLAQNTVTNPAIIAETGGGAIFNMRGKLIGIASPQYDNFGSLNPTAIPISTVKKALSVAVPGIFKFEDRKSLGIETTDAQKLKLSSNMKKILKISATIKEIGIKVKSVELNSAADEAGIQPGDVILTYNNAAITSSEILHNLEKLTLSGETITMKILRKNTILDIEICK